LSFGPSCFAARCADGDTAAVVFPPFVCAFRGRFFAGYLVPSLSLSSSESDETEDTDDTDDPESESQADGFWKPFRRDNPTAFAFLDIDVNIVADDGDSDVGVEPSPLPPPPQPPPCLCDGDGRFLRFSGRFAK
jgi:hypothetical protein